MTSRQFHQHFTRAFFVQKFVQSQTLSREKIFVQKMHVQNVDEIDTLPVPVYLTNYLCRNFLDVCNSISQEYFYIKYFN